MKIYNCFPGGKCKALTMSYDDGVLQDERLIRIFDKYGIKGTFNINAGLIGSPNRKFKIPKENIKEMYKDHEIATHSYTHPTIARIPLVDAAREILQDREVLEEITGGLVRGHAYPMGSYSEDIKVLFKQIGIAYGRVVEPKSGTESYALPDDPLEWHPTCHHNDPQLMEKGQWFLEYKSIQYLRLMYVWGHSHEFDKDNNWNRIEAFCRLMGGHDEIWYATNIEIIDYLEVLKRLKFSGNGRCVYNPSAQSAWLMVDDEKIVEIAGGAYVNLEEESNNAD